MTKRTLDKLSILERLPKNQLLQTPTTSKMGQLLAKAANFVLPKRGDQVEGKVSQVLPDRILVDFGGKSEGEISGREFVNLKKADSLPAVGEKIQAVVVNPEDETGVIILSIKLSGTAAWEKLEKLVTVGEEIEAKVQDLVRGGVLIEVLGLRGFIPAQFANLDLLANFDEFRGKKIKVTPIEVNRGSNRLICTAISQAPMAAGDLTKKFEIGQKYQGKVTAILPFGLVVNFDNLAGFVPNSELSWEKIDNLAEFFKIGQDVEFVFLGTDKSGTRAQISLKLATPDPWETVAEKYAKDVEIKGTISKVTDFGAFVTLENGVEGLVHISKIPPDLHFTVGDAVSCTVDSVDTTQRRISLSPVLTTKPVGYR